MAVSWSANTYLQMSMRWFTQRIAVRIVNRMSGNDTDLQTRWRVVITIAALAIVVTILGIWSIANKTDLAPAWTGFAPSEEDKDGKTLWDWLEILIIPVALATGALIINWTQKKTELDVAEKTRQLEREIAADRQHQATLEAYYDRMTDLLLNHKLREFSETDSEERSIARARTLAVLRSLDGVRKAQLFQFLVESHLFDQPEPIVVLVGADLSNTDLGGMDLPHTNFSYVDLTNADLSNTNLTDTNLNGAKLASTNLTGTNLTEAYLRSTNLKTANLYRTIFVGADLSEANLEFATFSMVNLQEADLTNASMSYARFNSDTTFAEMLHDRTTALRMNSDPGINMTGAKFVRANMENASFVKANLAGANLAGAHLLRADLALASLVGSDLTEASLNETKLHGADLTNAKLHGADLTHAELREADLTDAKLINTTLNSAHLVKATLKRCNLNKAVLRYTDLSESSLIEANLSAAYLEGANLLSANLTGADLRGVNLKHTQMNERTQLKSANLTGAIDWTIEQLKQAGNLEGATMPDGVQLYIRGGEGVKGPTFEEWKAQYLARYGGTEDTLRTWHELDESGH